jgi:nucleoside phosphorylase
MGMVLIFASIKRELKYLLRDFKASSTSSPGGNVRTYEALYRGKKIVFLQTGMGVKNSQAAFEYAFSRYGGAENKISLVLSIGFCGIVRGDKQAGGLLPVRKAISYPEGKIIEIPAGGLFEKSGAALITMSEWTKKSELKKVSAETPLACDMETFPLAEAALSKAIPFGALKSVTDEEDEELAFTPEATTREDGNFDLRKTLGFIASHPALLKDAFRLAGASRMAASSLSFAVRTVLERI